MSPVLSPSVVLGVPIDALTMDEAVERIDDMITRGRAERRTHQVATVNVDFLVNALEDDRLLRTLQRTDMNLADGAPVVWASRWLGTPIPERVAGADLVPTLARCSAERGWRIHLFGGGPGVAERAATMLRERYPGALISVDQGPIISDPTVVDPGVVESIVDQSPDILCVALGNPKQEHFIDAYRSHVRTPVMIGIGGSLDMLTGDKRRAPKWMGRLGVEWIYRAAQEPGRLGRRYLHDIVVFAPRIARYIRRVRPYRRATDLRLAMADSTTVRLRSVSAGESSTDEGPDEPTVDLASATSVDIIVHGVTGLSPAAHGQLVGLLRHAGSRRLPIVIDHITPSLERCLESYGTAALVDDLTKS